MIVAGIDPGSAQIGVSILDTDARQGIPAFRARAAAWLNRTEIPAKPSLVATATIEVGAKVARAKPITYTRKDGLEVTVDHERSHAPEDFELAADQVVWLLREHGVSAACIEWVPSMYMRNASMAASAVGTHLIRAAYVAGIIWGAARRAGISVSVMTERKASAITIGGGRKGRGEVSAEPYLCDHVLGWYRYSRIGSSAGPEHERDAALLALASVAPPPAPPAPKVKAQPKPRGKGKTPYRDRRRPPPPCGCPSSHHYGTCMSEAAVAARAKRAEGVVVRRDLEARARAAIIARDPSAAPPPARHRGRPRIGEVIELGALDKRRMNWELNARARRWARHYRDHGRWPEPGEAGEAGGEGGADGADDQTAR